MSVVLGGLGLDPLRELTNANMLPGSSAAS